MNKIILIFIGLSAFDCFWMANGVSLNPSGGASVGDPAPGRSPGPPDLPEETLQSTKVSEEVSSKCELHGTLKETDQDLDFNFTIHHPLFRTEELVQGLVYEGRWIQYKI